MDRREFLKTSATGGLLLLSACAGGRLVGTKEPESVGRASSDGCVRLVNGAVEELFAILPEGASILVRE